MNNQNPERSCYMLKIPASSGISEQSLLLFLEYVYTGTVTMTREDQGFETLTVLYTTAAYFQVDALMTEAKARILANLFHGASLHSYSPSFDGSVIQDSSSLVLSAEIDASSPCLCPQCCALVARILRFALCDPVAHRDIIDLSHQALLAIFGPGWCSPEFDALPQAAKQEAVQGIVNLLSPDTVCNILLHVDIVVSRLSSVYEVVPTGILMQVRNAVDAFWGTQTELWLGSPQLQQIIVEIGNITATSTWANRRLERIFNSILRGIYHTDGDRQDVDKKAQIVREILGHFEFWYHVGTQSDWNQKFLLCFTDARNKLYAIAKQAPTKDHSRTRMDQRHSSVPQTLAPDTACGCTHTQASVIRSHVHDPDETNFPLYNAASAALAARSISWHSNSSFTGSETTEYGSICRQRTIVSFE